MVFYRIRRWPSSDGGLDQLRFRKALTAMSVRPVDLDWLTSRSGLTQAEAAMLLERLGGEGALVIELRNAVRPGAPLESAALPAGWRQRLGAWLLRGGMHAAVRRTARVGTPSSFR